MTTTRIDRFLNTKNAVAHYIINTKNAVRILIITTKNAVRD